MDKDNDRKILRRYLNSTYRKEEVERISEILGNDSQKGLLDELAGEVWEEAELQPEITAEKQGKYLREAQLLLLEKEKNGKQPVSRKSKRLLYTTLGIAASIALLIGIANLWMYWQTEQVTLLQAQTSFGEKKEIMLADGSCIVLNACSTLEYPDHFTGNSRNVTLHGEAYFKIARDPEKPFRIQTEKFGIEVLGTAFNVKSYSNDHIQSVEVENGKVQLNLPEDRIRLSKQEQIFINQLSGEYNKRKYKENKVAIWRKGNLHFNQTPLHDVARELERQYHCRIHFQEGQTFNHLISGEHDNQDLESILESISYVCGINYEKNQNEINIFK